MTAGYVAFHMRKATPSPCTAAAPGTPESSYDTAYASGHSTNDSAHCTLIANTSANATLVAMAAARGMRCGSVRAMFPDVYKRQEFHSL